MSKPEPVDGLSDEERQLLLKGLRALRRDRGLAWNIACDIADQQGRRRPSIRSYGIDDIERLARRLQGTSEPGAEG